MGLVWLCAPERFFLSKKSKYSLYPDFWQATVIAGAIICLHSSLVNVWARRTNSICLEIVTLNEYQITSCAQLPILTSDAHLTTLLLNSSICRFLLPSIVIQTPNISADFEHGSRSNEHLTPFLSVTAYKLIPKKTAGRVGCAVYCKKVFCVVLKPAHIVCCIVVSSLCEFYWMKLLYFKTLTFLA